MYSGSCKVTQKGTALETFLLEHTAASCCFNVEEKMYRTGDNREEICQCPWGIRQEPSTLNPKSKSPNQFPFMASASTLHTLPMGPSTYIGYPWTPKYLHKKSLKIKVHTVISLGICTKVRVSKPASQTEESPCLEFRVLSFCFEDLGFRDLGF